MLHAYTMHGVLVAYQSANRPLAEACRTPTFSEAASQQGCSLAQHEVYSPGGSTARLAGCHLHIFLFNRSVALRSMHATDCLAVPWSHFGCMAHWQSPTHLPVTVVSFAGRPAVVFSDMQWLQAVWFLNSSPIEVELLCFMSRSRAGTYHWQICQ